MPLYVCPICEPGPYHYVGTIVAKVCSGCRQDMTDAPTGQDRRSDWQRNEPPKFKCERDRNPAVVPLFNGIDPVVRKWFKTLVP